MAERNPLARFLVNPTDLGSRPPRFTELPASIPPSSADAPLLADQNAYRRTGRFIQIPFTVGTTAQQIVVEQPDRFYCFILNTSGANQLAIGFDTEPTLTSGIVLAANLGFYEPYVTPTNAIFVLGGGAGTTGVCIVAVRR